MAIKTRRWQIDKCRWRYSLAGQTVTIHQHLNGTVSIRYGVVGRYPEGGGKGEEGSMNQLGHFVCYRKRTDSKAIDTG